jgi:hypothetical protein
MRFAPMMIRGSDVDRGAVSRNLLPKTVHTRAGYGAVTLGNAVEY